MSRMIESFKRLYKNGRMTEERLSELLADGTITQEEYDYIVEGE